MLFSGEKIVGFGPLRLYWTDQPCVGFEVNLAELYIHFDLLVFAIELG